MVFYNSSVKFHTKKLRSHNITVLYPNQCYNEVSYKGTVLYLSLIQACGNNNIFYLSRDKYMALMYLSKENFTCPTVQISLYLSVLKQFTLSKTSMKPCRYQVLFNGVDPDQLALQEAS